MSAAQSSNVQSIKPAMQLTPHQRSSYDVLASFCRGEHPNELAVLEGYAGTGKTTLIGQLVAEFADDMSIAIAAPTNKAVAVLAGKVGSLGNVESGSIHSFLGLRMVEKENGDQECKPDGDPSLDQFDLAIVDECSMISQTLLQHIALHRSRCKVIFVGDPAQLPPVGEKEISQVFRTIDLKVRLSEVVRQAADNPIIALSMKVRQWIEQERRPTPGDIAEALPKVYPMRAAIESGGEDTIREYARWALEEDQTTCRIVAFTNNQVKAHNAWLHHAIFGVTEYPFSPGELVIAQDAFEATYKNVKVRIMNSEEMVVTAVNAYQHDRYGHIQSCMVTVARDNGAEVAFPVAVDHRQHDSEIAAAWSAWRKVKSDAELLRGTVQADQKRVEAKKLSDNAWMLKKAFAPIRHAYAVTAHKSQGSTFHTVIVDFNDLAKIRSAFDFNRALYVAATRASDHLAIVV